MTPAPPQLVRHRGLAKSVPLALLGIVLLAAFFVPGRDPVTHRVIIEWRPSAELTALVFLVAIAALARPQFIARRVVAGVLALLVVAAAVLNLADAAAPALLGRDLNLYWDLRHMPS